jgi:hypothetical protein
MRNIWCGVAHGAAWLWLIWCSVAQLEARRLAVRQARVRFWARHHREGLPTELSSDEEMERPQRISMDKCIV